MFLFRVKNFMNLKTFRELGDYSMGMHKMIHLID